MRSCTARFFRLASRPVCRSVQGDGSTAESSHVNEKQDPKPRRWSCILLMALRCFQLAYFVFAYYSLFGFRRSSFVGEGRPWLRSPDQMDRPTRTMRWVRLQASMLLIYHVVVLIVPLLLRVLRGTKRPLVGLATVFGDGCAMVALVNTIVLLDSVRENHCRGWLAAIDLKTHGMISFDRARHGDASSHRSVCRSLNVVFGVAGVIVISYLLSATATVWRAKQLQASNFAKLQQQEDDVEQGIVQQHPGRAAELSSQVVLQREHSPPPPYDPVVAEPGTTASQRGRSSMETTSSLGVGAYLVLDGWRAPEAPPDYSSRPPSLHNGRP